MMTRLALRELRTQVETKEAERARVWEMSSWSCKKSKKIFGLCPKPRRDPAPFGGRASDPLRSSVLRSKISPTDTTTQNYFTCAQAACAARAQTPLVCPLQMFFRPYHGSHSSKLTWFYQQPSMHRTTTKLLIAETHLWWVKLFRSSWGWRRSTTKWTVYFVLWQSTNNVQAGLESKRVYEGPLWSSLTSGNARTTPSDASHKIGLSKLSLKVLLQVARLRSCTSSHPSKEMAICDFP
jgi:hypothetical protein